ncbi:MAG: hypothetical protein IJX51_05045 [Clostridia bacterium]|nr:hypothetical protein [Clostridia bacterium]
MDLIKAFDELPLIAKIIFALPGLDIIWAIYRIAKGALTSNLVMLVVGIVWVFAGTSICWILDLVFLILGKNPIMTE